MAFELTIRNDSIECTSSISAALEQADIEMKSLNETIESIKKLKPDCDRLDYLLAACSGVLCGFIDIFLVGKPGESKLQKVSDDWVENRVKDFAGLCGWEGNDASSAIRFLEQKFKIPYDQRGCGDAGGGVFGLNPSNHHFKSLAHNPTLCGLFFSILDQFDNTSHFISDGELITLEDADGTFRLQGSDVPSKLFCGFINWFGHLVSDVSGSSGGSGRGMGIPSPFWAWTNDIIAVKRSLDIPVSDFDKTVNELALQMYKEGFDFRFQMAQAIPVFINEMLVRFMYSTRRLIRYLNITNESNCSFEDMWRACEPFSNATVERMLTVAHGIFCLLDITDAVIRSFLQGKGKFNPKEFLLRINVVGVGRFTISLWGEVRRTLQYRSLQGELRLAEGEKHIVEEYIQALHILAARYDDRELLTFVDDFNYDDLYEVAFGKTAKLAALRGVPEEYILQNESDIDNYFRRGR